MHLKKTELTKFTAILFGLISLYSCDCYQVVTGIVVDKETDTPLRGVAVYKKSNPDNKTLTDSTGNFRLSSVFGGLFRCTPMEVVIKDENYKINESVIPAGGQKTIRLEKIVYLPYKDTTCIPKPDTLDGNKVFFNS